MVRSDGKLSLAPTAHPQATSPGHLVSPWTVETRSPLWLVPWSNRAGPPIVKGTALSQTAPEAHLCPLSLPQAP